MNVLLLGTTSYADEIFVALPEVTVTDSVLVDFDKFEGYDRPFIPTILYLTTAMNFVHEFAGASHEAAQLTYLSNANRLSKVCVGPITAEARSTTSKSDATTRWLAAQAVFNRMRAAYLLETWMEVHSKIIFRMDRKNYQGFVVTYADGVGETWAINPGYRTSSISLLDHPMPGSQTPWDGKPDSRCDQT